ncbi:MAG TPA: RdgB/HAM1 family non-canonical purine NTP pyrophosphatase [Candidatus Binatia bacterium]|nr:RdgB/HAM1 family non-canonical purine NTP pyrophosphatase [Candidatus Binatia bacterium]
MIPARLVLATGNPGKTAELRALVAEWGPLDVRALADVGTIAPGPETGATYLENAILKARAVAVASGLPALADDSGLEVDALGGEPGPRSARWAPSDAERIAKLLDALRDVPGPRRTARFRCVVALVLPDGGIEAAEGTCSGRIALRPAGTAGFGYDPVFVADELGRTLAEAGPAEKQKVSHRARAMRALGARLRRGNVACGPGPC